MCANLRQSKRRTLRWQVLRPVIAKQEKTIRQETKSPTCFPGSWNLPTISPDEKLGRFTCLDSLQVGCGVGWGGGGWGGEEHPSRSTCFSEDLQNQKYSRLHCDLAWFAFKRDKSYTQERHTVNAREAATHTPTKFKLREPYNYHANGNIFRSWWCHVAKPTNQPTARPTDQPSDRPTDRSTNQPTKQQVAQKKHDKPTNQQANNQQISRPTGKQTTLYHIVTHCNTLL